MASYILTSTSTKRNQNLKVKNDKPMFIVNVHELCKFCYRCVVSFTSSKLCGFMFLFDIGYRLYDCIIGAASQIVLKEF